MGSKGWHLEENIWIMPSTRLKSRSFLVFCAYPPVLFPWLSTPMTGGSEAQLESRSWPGWAHTHRMRSEKFMKMFWWDLSHVYEETTSARVKCGLWWNDVQEWEARRQTQYLWCNPFADKTQALLKQIAGHDNTWREKLIILGENNLILHCSPKLSSNMAWTNMSMQCWVQK